MDSPEDYLDELYAVERGQVQTEWEKFWGEYDKTPTVREEEPKCECGGDKLQLPHSTWCPKYIKRDV